MGSQPQVRTRKIIDYGKKTAYDLWTHLKSTYTRTNTQAVQNLKHRLEILLYSDNAEWDEYFCKFMANISLLASLREEFSEKEKTSRLVWSLPRSFSPIAIVSSFLDSFEKVEQAILAEIDWRNNPHNPQSNNLMVIVKLTSLRQEKAARRISRTEGTNGSNKISRIRNANVGTAIELGIEKRVAGTEFQIKKGVKESGFKATTRGVNPAIETSFVEAKAEGEAI